MKTKRRFKKHLIDFGFLLFDSTVWFLIWSIVLWILIAISLMLIPGQLVLDIFPVIIGAVVCAILWPFLRD